MKLVIFGSRSLQGENVYKFIEEKIKEVIKTNEIEYLITPGGIEGACKLSLEVAKKLLIPVKLYFYRGDTDTYKGKWGLIDDIRKRTKCMIKEGDYFLLFHDGVSKGTLWDLEKVKKAGKKYEYFIVKDDKSVDDWADMELWKMSEELDKEVKKII